MDRKHYKKIAGNILPPFHKRYHEKVKESSIKPKQVKKIPQRKLREMAEEMIEDDFLGEEILCAYFPDISSMKCRKGASK